MLTQCILNTYIWHFWAFWEVTLSLDEWFLIYWRITVPSTTAWFLEDEGTVILWCIRNHSPDVISQKPLTPRWEPQILCNPDYHVLEMSTVTQALLVMSIVMCWSVWEAALEMKLTSPVTCLMWFYSRIIKNSTIFVSFYVVNFSILIFLRNWITFFSNGRYIDYLSLTYATNKNRILKVTL